MYRMTGKIAWAFLVRRRTRSVLVVMMIAVSLWGLFFMEGIYDGMTEQMINNAIRSDSGHISLFGEGYRLDPDLSRQVDDVAVVDSLLARDNRVLSYVKRLKQDGLVATAHYSRGVAIFGVDLAAEEKHGRLKGYLSRGEFSFGKKGRGAIIGFKLADKLQVRIGSKIVLSAQDSHGEVSAAPLKVRGILKTNNMALDENAVFIGDQKARKLLSMDEGVSQVAVILHDEAQIAGLQQELRRQFPHLEILRWDELYPALMQSRVMMEGFNLVTSLLIFCVAALGIFGVMLVSVLERLREFGIMLAIGTRFSQLRNIIFVESFFLGFIGFSLGSLVGGATLYFFKVNGLDLSMFSDAFDEFGMDAVTYAIIRPGYFVTALAAVTLATFLSVLIPLRVLKKSKPIEAINKV
ncbi:MAG: FtsX-like permease family protein [Deltaproteobacteria bacterium]|nr:FtsX-like permease family protein [Deltaproteobacteria bacterium]